MAAAVAVLLTPLCALPAAPVDMTMAAASGPGESTRSRQGYPRVSPFEGLHWDGRTPVVLVRGTWYRPVQIGATPIEKVLDYCEREFGERAKKRFREDLIQVLDGVGARPTSDRIDLVLAEVDTGKRVVLRNVRMTRANRAQLRRGAIAGADLPGRGRGVPNPTRAGTDFAKISPFDGLRWVGDQPLVRIGSEWFELVSYDGFSTEQILTHCRQTFGRLWQKRFREDIVEVFAGLGHQAGRQATLVLRNPESPATTIERVVEATHGRRQALHGAAAAAERADRGALSLDADALDVDVRELGHAIRSAYSYRTLQGVDLERGLAELRAKLGDSASGRQLAVGVMKLLAEFGDGHTRIRGSSTWLPRGFLPLLPVPSGTRIVAVEPDGDGLLDPEHPFLAAIDGRGIETWLEAAATIAAKGHPAFVRHGACYRLLWIQFVRDQLGMEPTRSIRITLADAAGNTTDRTLGVQSRPPRPVSRPTTAVVLEDNVGYLRIDSMDTGPAFEQTLRDAMRTVKDTRGLILDVRDNGGGTRDALQTLLPYFLTDQQPARVVNVAAARIGPDQDPNDPNGHLENRSLYPAAWSGWSAAAKKAIRATARTFQPDWQLPSGEFSDWHYMVVERKRSMPRYAQPVVLLINTGCFSATDVFVGGFAGLPQVTLMGTTTGGGSGRSRTYHLPRSLIAFRLSSMASFRPTGARYDGLGIAPDVKHEATPQDLAGVTDTMLVAARARLLR